MRTIDFHTHILTDAFRDGMAELGIDPLIDDGFPLPAWDVEQQLAFMDEAAIDHAVLTAPSPHIHNGNDEAALRVARKVNDEAAEICRAHPDRLSFAACVPLPYVEGAIEEANRAMDELGAVGVKVATNNNGIYLGDPALDPFFEALNERGAMVIMHPCRAKESPRNCITGGVAAIYEYPSDTTRAVLNMVANKTMSRYPNIRFVVPHCGSFLPYMLQRFAGVSGILASKGMMEPTDIYEETKGLWFDIAGDPEPVSLDMLRMVVPDDHIVYGSDFPHSPAHVVIPKKQSLGKQERFAGIDLKGNGEALLGAS